MGTRYLMKIFKLLIVLFIFAIYGCSSLPKAESILLENGAEKYLSISDINEIVNVLKYAVPDAVVKIDFTQQGSSEDKDDCDKLGEERYCLVRVYTGVDCGSMCGGGKFYAIGFSNGRWQVLPLGVWFR